MSSGLPLGLEWSYIDTPVTLEELTYTVQTPPANNVRVYAKDSSGISTLCYKNDAGIEICLPTSGSFVTGTGVDNQLAIWNGVNAIDNFALTPGSILFGGVGSIAAQDNASLFWDNTNKRLGIGLAAPTSKLEVADTVATAIRGIRASQFTADAQPANFSGLKSRNTTVGALTAVLLDDGLCQLGGFGNDGSIFTNQAAVLLKAGENWSGTNKGTYISLFTTPTGGSTTIAERFRVGPSGQWGIGGATFGGSGDIFSSGGAAAAPTWVTRATLNAALDHGTLAGLGDDDHTQYALLAGRSGGQTLKGGTASGDDLTLMSTNNATKGNIFFGTSTYDEVNNNLGIGTTSPLNPLHIIKNSTANASFRIEQYGGSNPPTALMVFGRGTAASPTAVQSGDLIGDALQAYGQYDTTPQHISIGALVRTNATENYDATHGGAELQYYITPNAAGVSALSLVMSITSPGVIRYDGGNGTGATSTILGTASPATVTTPYTWVKCKAADGTTCFHPIWK